MRTLITANDSTWGVRSELIAEEAIISLLNKHPDATIVVGQGYAHEKIAQIAHKYNASNIHIYYDDVKTMRPPGLELATKITVPSLGSKIAFNNFVVDSVMYIIAIDQGDPLAILGISKGKNVWFPSTGKIVSARSKTASQ